MKKVVISFFVVVMTSLSIVVNAGAILDISTPLVKFDAKSKRTQYITVKNIGNEKGYVGVQVFEATKPRDQQSQKDTLEKSFKMIISPRRMILKPGQSKRIRVLNLTGSVEKDRVIDIVTQLVKPNVSAKEIEEGGMGIQVKGAIVHLTQVYVVPKSADIELAHKIATLPATSDLGSAPTKAVEFTNKGNSTVFLRKGELCQQSSQCESLEPLAVYPSETKMVELPKASGTITYTRSDLENNSESISIKL